MSGVTYYVRDGVVDRQRLRKVRFYDNTRTSSTGCWEWQLKTSTGGYGAGHAHRRSWELFKGPIPAGAHVLHKCDNPPCVNPRHLYLGTPSDNMRDAVARGRHWQTRKIQCPNGHPYDGLRASGRRYCLTCHRVRMAERRQLDASPA